MKRISVWIGVFALGLLATALAACALFGVTEIIAWVITQNRHDPVRHTAGIVAMVAVILGVIISLIGAFSAADEIRH